MIERRRVEAYRLRVYIEQIKAVESMTALEWLAQWLKSGLDCPWVPRAVWLEYLRACALSEAEKLTQERVA